MVYKEGKFILGSTDTGQMIIKETPKETGQTVITICNYDKYNSQIIQEETEKKQQGNTKETPRKQQGNKVNKDKKENNIGDSDESLVCGTSQPHAEHIDYSELVKFFNEETKVYLVRSGLRFLIAVKG